MRIMISALLVAAAGTIAAKPPLLTDLIRHHRFDSIQLSPTGEYIAATVPHGRRRVLSILNLATMEGQAVSGGAASYVTDFHWTNDRQVVYSLATKHGRYAQPIATGELMVVEVGAKTPRYVFGYRASRMRDTVGKGFDDGFSSARVIDTLPNDDDSIILEVRPWEAKDRGNTTVWEINLETGTRVFLTLAPLSSSVLTDNAGVVRLAIAPLKDGSHIGAFSFDAKKLHWSRVVDKSGTNIPMNPIQFAADNAHVYAIMSRASGPDGLFDVDLDSGESKLLSMHEVADPGLIQFTHSAPIQLLAVTYDHGKPEIEVLLQDHPEAVFLRTLARSFPHHQVSIVSVTRDGKKILARVSSDRNPGTYYLYDAANGNKLTVIADVAPWLQGTDLPSRTGISLRAKDGLNLHGYLTLPPDKPRKNLPMVVVPHGGPIGVADQAAYDIDAAILASHGYAVLQINFRGSSGYGSAFLRAGFGTWGREMQDDVTQATRWAIEQGYADGDRVCIYGASYGGYAALMGVVREPTLYQCAIGSSGVYDLKLMKTRGEIKETIFGRAYLDEALGTDGPELTARSPITHAGKIKVPVMLVHGGEDERVPIEHAKRMRRALQNAGNKPEWIYQPREGHGFHEEKNMLEMYTRMLAFLDKHIGH